MWVSHSSAGNYSGRPLLKLAPAQLPNTMWPLYAANFCRNILHLEIGEAPCFTTSSLLGPFLSTFAKWHHICNYLSQLGSISHFQYLWSCISFLFRPKAFFAQRLSAWKLFSPEGFFSEGFFAQRLFGRKAFSPEGFFTPKASSPKTFCPNASSWKAISWNSWMVAIPCSWIDCITSKPSSRPSEGCGVGLHIT